MKEYTSFKGEIENVLSREEIIHSYIVRSEKLNNKHLVFSTSDEFDKYVFEHTYDGLHELILGIHPQKLKFDIDCTNMQINPDEMLDHIMNVILTEMWHTWPRYAPSRNSFLITTASKPGEKYSFHIISQDYIVSNNVDAKTFTDNIIEKIDTKYRQFIDVNVNRSLQYFRILHSAKYQSTRVKLPYGTSNSIKPSEACIAIRENESLYHILDAISKPLVPYNESLPVADIIDFIPVMAHFEYKSHTHNMIYFRRLSASYCRLCQRTHDTDNTMMIRYFINNHMLTLTEYCRHAPGKSLEYAEVPYTGCIVSPKIFNPEQYEKIIYGREDKLRNLLIKVKQHAKVPIYSQIIDKCITEIYTDFVMHDFPLHPSLCIKAEMKMGKTKALKKYINTYFNGMVQPTIVMVSFRQTFSSSIASSFENFTLYSEVEGNINLGVCNRLIIQVESLYRIKVSNSSDPVDLVVLDESESIFQQFSSGLHKYFNASFAVFTWLIKTAQNVICMDANLGQRTINLLKLMRPQPINLIINDYKNMTNDEYYITTNRGKWLSMLVDYLDTGNRVAIPTNSLTEAKSYAELIIKRFPKLKIGLYTSEMPISEKRKHFAQVNEYWKMYDLLIYTPTCSAGVSFEESHYDVIMASFISESCDVETCRQMIGRVRDVICMQYVVLLQVNHLSLPTRCESIVKHMYEQRIGLYKLDTMFEYANDGNIQLPNSIYFQCFVENMRVQNISRNSFDFRFIAQTLATGASIEMLESFNYDLENMLIQEYQLAKTTLSLQRMYEIAESEVIDSIKYESIKEQFTKQEDVPPADMRSYDKYQLFTFYNCLAKYITVPFIQTYGSNMTREWYCNLITLVCAPHIDDDQYYTANEIVLKLQEVEMHDHLERNKLRMENEDNSHIDSYDVQNNRYVYIKHQLAIYLLVVCGFSSPCDRLVVNDNTLNYNFKEHFKQLVAIQPKLIFEFGIKRTILKIDNMLESVLAMINLVLKVFYGVRIKKRRNSNEYLLYALHPFKIVDAIPVTIEDKNPIDIFIKKHIVNKYECRLYLNS